MSITEKLNQIKNAIYGKDVRSAIHDAIRECYDDASVNHDNANMEVKLARGIHKTLNDRLDNAEQKIEEANTRLSTAILNPKMFGAKGDGVADDLQAFNDMVLYGKSNGIKHIRIFPGDYNLSDTFYLPSGWALEGQGKVIVRQETKDSPVIATEEWKLNETPVGETKVKGINIKGSKTVGSGNHGLLIHDYYSTVDAVYVNNVGGKGIYFTSANSSGGKPTGTLVENTIKNCHVRNASDTPYFLGENNNNKLTDGIIQNCMVSATETSSHGLYVGSAAGWFVDNIHTYGKPNVAISLKNSYYTAMSNIYIEDFATKAIDIHIQNSITVNNVSISLRKTIEDGVSVVEISKADLDYGEANCCISNLNMVTSAFNNKVYGVNLISSKVKTSLSNYSIVGQSVDKVKKFKGDTTNLNYMGSFLVQQPLTESRYNLLYDNKKLKYCDSAKFTGSDPVSLTFKLQDILDFGKIMCDVAICGCAYDNGGLLTSYTSKLMVSAKDNSSDAWKVYVISESAKTGFDSEPEFSVNKTTGELTVAFTASDDRNAGIVAIDFVSIS